MNNHPNFPLSPPTPLEYSLFSPSKAAEQQRLQKDWTYIHSFLRQKYPSPAKIPKFEENEETLKALLALANANEKADEGWGVFCKVEGMAVEELMRDETTQSTTNNINTRILSTLRSSLSTHGLSTLQSHAKTSIVLNSQTTCPSTSLAPSILTLTTDSSTLENQITQLDTLTTSLISQTSLLSSELADLGSSNFQAAEKNLPQKTAETQRQTKLLKAKICEYDERLRNSSSSVPEALLSSVETARDEVEMLQKRVRGIEERIAVYEGVAPEPREIRRQMQELRRELQGLVERRDELFERMVAGRR
ncbi:hypothetical protein E4T39_08794 [Aureobasidium subglaciale]|nr:hypothetical protein E4T39_08794 [Aureobasidium subglaciale]